LADRDTWILKAKVKARWSLIWESPSFTDLPTQKVTKRKRQAGYPRKKNTVFWPSILITESKMPLILMLQQKWDIFQANLLVQQNRKPIHLRSLHI
jgi:hypothetical protein